MADSPSAWAGCRAARLVPLMVPRRAYLCQVWQGQLLGGKQNNVLSRFTEIFTQYSQNTAAAQGLIYLQSLVGNKT